MQVAQSASHIAAPTITASSSVMVPMRSMRWRKSSPSMKSMIEVLALVANRKMVGDAGQVRVAQACQDHRFEPELTRIFVCGEKVFLNGYIDAKILVHRTVNGPHSALPKNFDNAITFMKKSAALQRHLSPIVIFYP